MSARLMQLAGHSWRVGTPRPLAFAVLDALAVGPLRRIWEKEVPWQVGKLVERRGNQVRLDGCRLDVGSTTFTTFQRGCLWLSRHEEPERIAVCRYVDPALPVVELGASTGMLSCLINRRLQRPESHVAVEANPDLIPVIAANRRLNHAAFTALHAALAYDQDSVAFAHGEDHLAGRASGDVRTAPVAATTLQGLMARFDFDRATLVSDIEGMEIELWRRERNLIARRIACMIVELHEPISGKAAVDGFIRGMCADGFELVWERNWTRVFRNTR